MDRLDSMQAFIAAVDHGSLAAAARRLGHSPAALTRAVASLEARLGTPLLVRTTRSLHLTRFGESYLVTCRRVLADLEAAERGAEAEQEMPRGLLTVTAPILFGRMVLRPLVDQFLSSNAAVQVRLLLLDRVVNLVDEAIDAAVRLAHLPDSGLVATRLGEVRQVVCASPGYVAKNGRPVRPADLLRHACIVSNTTASIEPWMFGSGAGSKRRTREAVKVSPRLSVIGSAAAIDSALDDRGVVRVLSYQVEEHLRKGRLLLLLTRFEPPSIPVHLVFPESRRATARLRAFIDFAAPHLRTALARITAGVKTR